MEKKQTPVEWLELYLLPQISSDPANRARCQDLINKAKQMEKQQMFEFAKGFWYWANGADAPPVYLEDVEKYYKKTYEK